MSRESSVADDRGTTLTVEDYLDDEGQISLPPGVTLMTQLERNVAELGDAAAYRYLDYSHDPAGCPVELTWNRLGTRMRAIAARLQQVITPGERVAVLAPQGVDYVIGFFAVVRAGGIAVPLFAPELPGHAERLESVFADARPAAVLTTTAVAKDVRDFLRTLPRDRRIRVIAIDGVPDSVGATLVSAQLDTDDIAYLQYTSGSTRTPAGVEISHRAVCMNVLQMITSIGLQPNITGVSWLPLFHDMGLLMVLFPALCGGHVTLMSPTAFVRRPNRWIRELSAQSACAPVFAAAPNFAFDLAVQRGLPADGESIDLSNVAGLINGSEPVNMDSIQKFYDAFAPYGLPLTAIKPSYGMAEATLFVSTIDSGAEPTAVHLDREQLGLGRAVPVSPDAGNSVALVSCGHVSLSQWATIVAPQTESELPDGQVGEIWLHGDNLGHGYWGNTRQSDLAFHNKLQVRLEQGSHAEGAAVSADWFRTGDLGVYVDGQLYIAGRIKDLVIVDGRNHFPQDIEATAAAASAAVRPGFVAAFSVPADELPGGATAAGTPGERLVIVAERAVGAGKSDPASVVEAIRAAVSRQHALSVADVQLVAAGSIPRTTSGKLARRACRANYLTGR